MFTSNKEIAKRMQLAADAANTAADYNTHTEATMRASRAGLPLLHQFLEDRVFTKLSAKQKPWEYSKKNPDYNYFDSHMARIQNEMRVIAGYSFEQVVYQILTEENPDSRIEKELELNYKGINGHCDFVVINDKTRTAKVVECKAIKVFSAKEAMAQKLFVDNYGYFTQMSLYIAAIKRVYVDYEVTGEWRVWAKRVDKSYCVQYPHDAAVATNVAEEAIIKREQYETAFKLYDVHLFKEAAEYLFAKTETLPEKIFNNGYYNASCFFHFSPFVDLIVDQRGFFVDNIIENLMLMMECAQTKDENSCKKLYGMLDKSKSV